MIQDHYRALGVPQGASQENIRAAYLELVKKHHPDTSKKGGSPDKFKAAAAAWEVLGDESKRALYDERLGDATIRPGAGARRTPRAHRGHWPGGPGSAKMPPILQAFEFATHPKVLLVAVPTLLVGYMLLGGRSDGNANTEKVDAWLNPSTNRWETPAPWDEGFRKNRHLVQKVDRDVVHQSTRR